MTGYGEQKTYYLCAVALCWRALQTTIGERLARIPDVLSEPGEGEGDWPPHSLFCKGHCCNRSFRKYHQFLKRELNWDKHGHLR